MNLMLIKSLKKGQKPGGKVRKNRAKLIKELDLIAMDCDSDSKFERICNQKFEDFLKVSSDYHHELHKLKLMLLLDANLFFYLDGSAYQLFEKVLKAPSLETLLVIGGLSVAYAKQHLTAVLDILKKADERREATGYAIYNNYQYLM